MRPEVITGSEGFIGKHLYNHIKTKYGPIMCLDKKTGQDITKPLELPNDLGMVYHLAAISSVPECEKDHHKAHLTNVTGTANVLGAAVRSDYLTFAMTSSAAVYGNRNDICSEEDSTKPINAYGKSKLQAEHILLAKPNTVCLRLFNVYGINGKGVVNKFIDNALMGKPLLITGDGTQTRDFVHVNDVCRAFTCARQEEGVYNIGSGAPITMNELADTVISLCNSNSSVYHVAPVKGDIKHSCADISKAGDDLGWSPEISLEDGIKGIIRTLQQRDVYGW